MFSQVLASLDALLYLFTLVSHSSPLELKRLSFNNYKRSDVPEEFIILKLLMLMHMRCGDS